MVAPFYAEITAWRVNYIEGFDGPDLWGSRRDCGLRFSVAGVLTRIELRRAIRYVGVGDVDERPGVRARTHDDRVTASRRPTRVGVVRARRLSLY